MVDPDRIPASNDDPGLAALQKQVERLDEELAVSRDLLRTTAATRRSNAAELARLQRELRTLKGRRSVRYALAASEAARRTRALVRRIAAGVRRRVRKIPARVAYPIRQRRLRSSAADETALIAALREDLVPPAIDRGPLVSIVILNRDGRDHLERCLGALATTAYRDVEVIVVDNGSTDGSAELAERSVLPFPITVQRNSENRSFSEANAQGVALAKGDLICFLNNDVDPITEHWLGYLVETIETWDAVAVGARLIYPRHRGGRRGGVHHPDLSLQHSGVAFDRATPIPLPRVVGAAQDPLGPDATEIAVRPSLTAACLLVRRVAFEAVGGFTLDYDYGLEDVDLCLKLRAAGGRLVYDGRAALWHHESATRKTDLAGYRARIARNRDEYVDRWGPRIFREALLDALAGGDAFSSVPIHVAITVTSDDPDAGFGDWYTAHELGDALEALGWRVSYLERAADGWYEPSPGVEAVVVLLDACDIRRLPRGLVTMAWIRNWPDRWLERPWFDEFDLVFGSSERIVEMVRSRSAKVASLLPIATNPTRFGDVEPSPELACDVLFIGSYWNQHRDVVDALPALAARGYSVHVYGRGWDDVPGFAALDRGFLPYDDVPRAYASARIVVDDAASSTKACGSVNSRVFDALSVGAVVLTNSVPGVPELFDADFPTWSDASSLVDLVEATLADPEAAASRAAAYQAIVRRVHTYPLRAAAVRDAMVAWASSTRFGLRIGVPSWDVIERWGDYHFARGLQRALERAGHPTRLHFFPDWAEPVAAREDVTIHLFGLKEAPTRRGQVNLLWQISHPDLATPELYERYDHVFVASDGFATRMASLVDVPVGPLHQATDPERFKPEPNGPPHELLFVANSRKIKRRIVDDLADTAHDLAIYGHGWTPDLVDPRFVKAESIPNTELASYYSAATIVLNDHWDDMRDEGFISNRLYDALACGAFVISDHVDGIEEEFDGAVATYRLADELEPLISRYLSDPAARHRLGRLGRDLVLERHTFDVRARTIAAIAASITARRPDRITPATNPTEGVAVS